MEHYNLVQESLSKFCMDTRVFVARREATSKERQESPATADESEKRDARFESRPQLQPVYSLQQTNKATVYDIYTPVLILVTISK